MRPRAPWGGVCLIIGWLTLAPRAGAADAKPAAPTRKGQPDPVEALAPGLRGPEDQAVEAAQKLAALPGPRAVDLLLDALVVGAPPRVAAALLEALAPKKDPRAAEVLAYYAHDRNPELRRLAVSALGVVPDPRVTPLLIAALSDAMAEVRGAAAQALGARREKSAEPQLLKLLARKDASAPAALGQIGGPETARTLAEMVGNVPDRLLVQSLAALLQRPDFGPGPLRLEVVKTLGKMPGNDAVEALSDYIKATAKDKNRPSRAEAGRLVEERSAK